MSNPARSADRGCLALVATPIGNLEDITLRALRTLREADAILAEDTRRSAQLCRHHGIEVPLRSFHAHSPPHRIAQVVEELTAGARYALISDAGTPLVSDPGAELVRAARAAGVRVEAIPGASAPVAALISSGLSHPRFQFVGFLPRGGKTRRESIARIARYSGASVLFEAPSRLRDTLLDLEEALGSAREVAVCRELTKLHEEIATEPLSELLVRFAEKPLGELTLVVSAPSEDPADEDERPNVDDETILAWLAEGSSSRDAADRLAELTKVPRKDAYRRVLELTKT
jgi:16S rRNA (cytidine1402-2'-O)-methyltransferase